MNVWKNLNKIELEISGDCNAACPLCPRTEANVPLRGNGNHTLQDIINAFEPIQERFEDDNFEVALYGLSGDPILNPECYEIIKWFTDRNANVIMSTNGGYNTPEWWAKLAQLDNLVVKWAIDGAEETNHIYRINVVWNTVLRNLKSFTNAGGKAVWVFIPFDHNMNEFNTAKNLAIELGCGFESKTSGRNADHEEQDKAVQVNKHKKKEEPKERKYKQSKTIPHRDLSKLNKIRNELDAMENQESYNDNLIQDAINTIECKALNEPELYVSGDFKLYPCCFLHDSERFKNTPWGELESGWNDLRKHDLQTIVNQKPFVELKERWNPNNANFVKRCLHQCADKNSHRTIIKKIVGKKL